MLKTCLLDKINSRFVIENIFKYACKGNKFKLKFILYSSLCLKKLNITLDDYKYYNYKQSNFSIYEYIYMDFEQKIFDKNILYNEVKEKLKEINLTIEDIKNLLKNNIEKEEEKKNLISENDDKGKKEDVFLLGNVIPIDIYSPFIDVIISYEKDKDFINIPLNYIVQFNLNNDYISFFQKDIENNNLLYINFDEINQIKLLKELKINSYNSLYLNSENELNNNEYNLYFSTIFSLENIENNLETLILEFPKLIKVSNSIIENNECFNQINNLKSLKNIEFANLYFKDSFIITLNKLERINFQYCKNICFENENTISEVQYLKLNRTNIESGNISYKLYQIKDLTILHSKLNIDFTSITDLKSLEINDKNILEQISHFPSLEILTIPYLYPVDTEENEKELFDIIISNTSLKDINIGLREITNEKIAQINNNINEQIESIKIIFKLDNFDFRSFIAKFKGIKNFKISSFSNDKKKFTFAEIQNDDSIIIEKFSIFSNVNTVLYFSFKEIQKLYLSLNSFDINVFPLFNKRCEYTFDALQRIQIICKENMCKFEVIDNLYNNIDKCLSLDTIQVNLVVGEFDKKFYFKFIDKIATNKIRNFYFILQKRLPWNYSLENNYYTRKELKNMFPTKIFDYFIYSVIKYENI